MQLRLFSGLDFSFVFYKRQDIHKNDDSFLVDRPVVPRLDNKYVGLDLTWLDA